MTDSSNNGHSSSVTAPITSAALAVPATTLGDAKELYGETESPIAAYNFKPWKTRWVAPVVLFFAVTLVGAFAAASSPRIRHERDLAAAAEKQASGPPRRAVATVRRGTADSKRELPGNALADFTAAIYGRTNGYLKRWLFDIGDHVKAGQLMAEIATPEIDAQLEEAK